MNNLDPKSAIGPRLLTWEVEEAYKNAPRPEPKFKKHDRVKTPVGNMIVIDPDFGRTLINGVWIPNVRLGFIKKNLDVNNRKKHRFFSQERLQILNYDRP